MKSLSSLPELDKDRLPSRRAAGGEEDFHIGVSVEPTGTHVQVWDGETKLYEQFHEMPKQSATPAPASAGQAGQVVMTTKATLQQVLQDMRALSPEALRAELDRHKDGELATALREVGEFFTERAAAPADLAKGVK